MIDDLDEKKKEALRLTWERVRRVVFEGSGQGPMVCWVQLCGLSWLLTSLTLASLPGVGGLGLAFFQHQVQSAVQGVLQGLRGLLVTQVNTDFGSIFSMLLPGTTAQLQPPEGTSFLQGGCFVQLPAGSAIV